MFSDDKIGNKELKKAFKKKHCHPHQADAYPSELPMFPQVS
jgi:hypothetical protein